MHLVVVLTKQLCTVLVVVRVSAKLDEWKVGKQSKVRDETKDKIVSQWREVCADEKHRLRDRVSEILRPLGDETRLVVMRRDNTMHALALYFICMTLSAVMSLRDQWRRRQLRDIVKSLFTFLSRATVEDNASEEDDVPEEDEDHVPKEVADPVERFIWRLVDYDRCLGFFSLVQGMQSNHKLLCAHYMHSLRVFFHIQ